jgi:hypothetical protein
MVLMNNELESFDRSLIEALSQNLPGGAEENHENYKSHSNQAPHEYKLYRYVNLLGDLCVLTGYNVIVSLEVQFIHS